MLEEISYPKLLENDIGGPRKIMRNIKGLGLWKSWVLESLALKFGDLKWSSLINTSSQLIIYTNFLPSDLYDGGKNNTSWISSLLHSSDYCFLNPIFGRVSIFLTFSPQILVWLHGSRDKKKLIFFNLLDLQTQRDPSFSPWDLPVAGRPSDFRLCQHTFFILKMKIVGQMIFQALPSLLFCEWASQDMELFCFCPFFPPSTCSIYDSFKWE